MSRFLRRFGAATSAFFVAAFVFFVSAGFSLTSTGLDDARTTVLNRLAVASRALAILKEDEFLLLRILIIDDDMDADRESATDDDLAEEALMGEEPRARCIIIIIDAAAYGRTVRDGTHSNKKKRFDRDRLRDRLLRRIPGMGEL